MNKIEKILFEQLQRHSTDYIESAERGIVCDDLDVDGFIEETSKLLQANGADTGSDSCHIQNVTTRFQSDKMWDVAMENGKLYTNTLSWTRKAAIDKFMGNKSAELDWRYFKRKYGIHAKKITADFLNGW